MAEYVRWASTILHRLPAGAQGFQAICIQPDEHDAVYAAAQGMTVENIGEGYRPSGKTQWLTLLLTMIGGAAAALLVAWIFSLIPWSLILLSALIYRGSAFIWQANAIALRTWSLPLLSVCF